MKGSTRDVVQLVIKAGAERMKLVIVPDPDPMNQGENQPVEFTVSPQTGFTNGPNNLHLEGVTSSDDVTSATIEVRVLDAQGVDTGRTCARLHVMALPPRIVSLGIYRVEDPTSPGTQGVSGPSDQQILGTLNEIYDQAGIHFQLDGSSGSSLDVHYDVYSGGLYTFAPDCRLEDTEYQHVSGGESTRAGKLLIYLAKKSGVQPPRGPQDPLDDDDIPYSQRVYVRGDTEDDPILRKRCFVFVETTNNDEIAARIAAHEVGHVLRLSVTPGAAANGSHDPGPFPRLTLPDTGLMKPGNGADRSGKWLSHVDWRKANETAGSPFLAP